MKLFIALVALSVFAFRPAAASVEATASSGQNIPLPRGAVVTMPAPCSSSNTGFWDSRAMCWRQVPVIMDIEMISDGRRLVRLDSIEGQSILMERAVNLRTDGSIRHRQHHRPFKDFD